MKHFMDHPFQSLSGNSLRLLRFCALDPATPLQTAQTFTNDHRFSQTISNFARPFSADNHVPIIFKNKNKNN